MNLNVMGNHYYLPKRNIPPKSQAQLSSVLPWSNEIFYAKYNGYMNELWSFISLKEVIENYSAILNTLGMKVLSFFVVMVVCCFHIQFSLVQPMCVVSKSKLLSVDGIKGIMCSRVSHLLYRISNVCNTQENWDMNTLEYHINNLIYILLHVCLAEREYM